MTPNPHQPDQADKPAAKPQPKRRWYQFSLWSMFVWVTVIGVGLAVGMLWVAPAQQQRAVVEMVERLGGFVQYAVPPRGEGRLTTWLRDWLPRDYFDVVYEIDLGDRSVADADLRSLGTLTELKWLILDNTQVTDAKLAGLRDLKQLQLLSFSNTPVTDAGLAHLSGLIELQELWLNRTQVTDAGVAELRQALPNCRIKH